VDAEAFKAAVNPKREPTARRNSIILTLEKLLLKGSTAYAVK
jgi:hypothetical protein